MGHSIHKVQSFTLLDGYTVRVELEDGASQVVDLEQILRGELYGPLRDLSLFRQVRIDPEAHTLVWPNGADFDPATLRDWPNVRQQFAAMAAQWETNG